MKFGNKIKDGTGKNTPLNTRPETIIYNAEGKCLCGTEVTPDEALNARL